PVRFRKSKSVGAVFGLTCAKYQSGEIDRTGAISRCGDEMVRTTLYEAAQILLVRSTKWSWLKAWAMQIARRRGMKRAIVALARRLAVIMHRIWVDGTEFRWTLVQRVDGPVYVLARSERVKALRATDLDDATVRSAEEAAALSFPYAGQPSPDIVSAPLAVAISAAQWTFGEQYDLHRPLYRIALNDPAGTERYLSATTGEIVLTTTRGQRRWNYFGSIAHWIYPEALRRNLDLWSRLVWWLALLASTGASLGAVIGVSRIERRGSRLASPYGGWQAWHHWLGLVCMPFVLTWIASGWLSMDNGRLFSTGETVPAQARAITGAPDWQQLPT